MIAVVNSSPIILLAKIDRLDLLRDPFDEVLIPQAVHDEITAGADRPGAFELTLGRTLAIDQAVEVRDRWQDGWIDFGYTNWIVIYPQFVNPEPPVVADLRFRRGLLHALDRQTMAETIHFGLTPVAHWFIYPDHPMAVGPARRDPAGSGLR